MIIRKKIKKGQESAVLKKINNFNRKVERLKSKGQLDINVKTISPLFKEINKENFKYISNLKYRKSLLDSLKKEYVYIEFEAGSIVNLNEYNILGSINIDKDEGEYTLSSYSEKDLPKKYRNLETPSKCEHCNINRRRDNIYIIQNKKTGDLIQVGSSCMNDYIGNVELDLLIKFNEIENKIKSKEKQECETILYGKNDFLARAIKNAEKNLVNKNYFNTEKIKMEMKNNEKIEEKYEDMADDVIDFYEEIDVSLFSDSVFNVKKIVASKSDFLTLDEIEKIGLFLEIKNAIENKDKRYIMYSADFKGGFERGKNGDIEYKERDLLYVSKLAQDNIGFIRPNENPNLNTVDHIIMIINPLRIDEICKDETENYKKDLFDKIKRLNKVWNDSKLNGEVDKYYEDVINKFENMEEKSDFDRMLKEKIKFKIEKKTDLRSILRKLIWVNVRMKDIQKEEEMLYIELRLGDIFDKTGEGFDEWELELIGYNKKTSVFSDYTEFLFKDERRNHIIWRTTKENEMGVDNLTKEEWESKYKGKQIIVSGKFKRRENYAYIEHLNKRDRIYFVKNLKIKEINEEKKTDGDILLDKKRKYNVEYFIVSGIDREQQLNIYDLKGDNGEEKKITTKKNLEIEIGKSYTIAYKGDKNIKNVNNNNITERKLVEKKEDLTERQLKKLFENENKV